MISRRGHLCPFIVKIEGKPHPVGVKIYDVADNLNWFLRFWLYFKLQPSNATIVSDLVRSLATSTNHLVIADRQYGGVNLGDQLSEAGFAFIVKCSSNQPTSLWGKMKNAQLQSQHWIEFHNNHISAILCRDEKDFHRYLTNIEEIPTSTTTPISITIPPQHRPTEATTIPNPPASNIPWLAPMSPIVQSPLRTNRSLQPGIGGDSFVPTQIRNLD